MANDELKRIRESYPLTLAALLEKVNISISQLQRFERGT